MVLYSSLSGAVLFAILITTLMYWLLSRQTHHLEEKLVSLRATEQMLARKKPLQAASVPVQSDVPLGEIRWLREQAATAWTALTFDYSEHVCFTRFSQNKHVLVFTGEARSVTDLTEFLLHWPGVQHGETVEIDQIQHLKSGKTYFRFHVEGLVV
jgi:hypothetical protein